MNILGVARCTNGFVRAWFEISNLNHTFARVVLRPALKFPSSDTTARAHPRHIDPAAVEACILARYEDKMVEGAYSKILKRTIPARSSPIGNQVISRYICWLRDERATSSAPPREAF